jgi:hypothetical protein
MLNIAAADRSNPLNRVTFRPILSALHPPKKPAVNPPSPQQETAAAATFCGTPRLIRKKDKNGNAIAPIRLTRMPDQRIQKSAGNPPPIRCQSLCRFIVSRNRKRVSRRELRLLGALLDTLLSLASELVSDCLWACAPISRRKIGTGFRIRQSTRTFCPQTV